MAKIGVVEDDPDMGDYFLALLKQNGYEAALYPTAGRFFDSLIKSKPEAALIDMHLPGMHGREIIRVLRSNPETRGMLLIAMSAKEKKTEDVVSGFQAGADEYLVKPIDPQVLMVRLGALLRRGQAPAPEEETLKLGDMALNPQQRTCLMRGEEMKLTRLEFDLLVYFLRQANRVLTRNVILEAVWQGDPGMTTRTVDKHVEALRRKLGTFGKRLETVIRMGYIFKV